MNDAMITPQSDLTKIESHFRFGENWSEFANTVGAERIAEAVKGLNRLLPSELIQGRTFLDIGCGSGLSALAALECGASKVHGVDLDPASVATATRMLQSHAAGKAWSIEARSVFELDPAMMGTFDIVYSWGVLHHTGEMWRALESAAGMVAPGGILAVALYHRTKLCGFWRLEKRLYTRAGRPVQAVIQAFYKALFLLRQAVAGRNPYKFVKDYYKLRGMSWHHDVHDWLGGYPYESTVPEEVRERLARMGIELIRADECGASKLGFFGTACDEFVGRRVRAV